MDCAHNGPKRWGISWKLAVPVVACFMVGSAVGVALTISLRKSLSGSSPLSDNQSSPTLTPSSQPTEKASSRMPSFRPTSKPVTVLRLSSPSEKPSWSSSSKSSLKPSGQPSFRSSLYPSGFPTLRPSVQPSQFNVSYVPGELSVGQLGLLLSTGLKARILARSGQQVGYDMAGKSFIPFHLLPDYGATYADKRPENEGGWIYVSNCEVRLPINQGGVGALTFDKEGRLIDYRMVLEGTTANCGGGRTPWESYISCEEHQKGLIWQVDPTGKRPARQITLGSEGGLFESFAYDARYSHYFATEDHLFGALQRFIPTSRNTTDPWEELHGEGKTTYLRLAPDSDSEGTYEWTHDKSISQINANVFYPNAEGIDVYENQLFFVSKLLKTLFVLNLDDRTYTSHTTRQGLFDGQPDQLQRIIGAGNGGEDLLYFTEDGGKFAGVHARDRDGLFYTILESPQYGNYAEETTGLAFSPSGIHMYIAYQRIGLLFEITREDGLPFQARSLNIKYHNTNAN
jgi:hypothetical protein